MGDNLTAERAAAADGGKGCPRPAQGPAAVIGGGFGGIAAALRLGAKGYRVTLYERAGALGGRAQVFEKGGFRHDAGPTVITAPFLFEELFTLFGRRMADFVTLVPLSPWYRFRFNDGTTFDYGGTIESTLAEIAKIEPADQAGYLQLVEHSRKLFDAGFTELADQPFDRPWSMIREIPRLGRLRADRTVWHMVCRYLRNPKLREAFSVQPLLVGGNPFDTTSIYGLIHYLERRWGVFFVMGGTGAMVQALSQLMAQVGIEVRLDTTVEKIETEGRRVTGVRLASGEVAKADIVVSDADPLHLYGAMLPAGLLSRAARLKQRSRLSMGLYVLYFGTRRQYPDVAHHTIWLGPRYRELLNEIFKARSMPADFSLYVHRPTATDPSFAPEGCDSFYVLCPVPNLNADVDWDIEGPALQARIVEALEATMLPGLKDAMTADFFMTPKDFATRYLSVAGAGFSIAPNFTQSAWFRFHNKGEGVDGLYLVGAGTHPGAGLPGVLSSAKVVERLVTAREAAGRAAVRTQSY